MVSDYNDDIAASVLKSSEKTLRYMRRKIEFLSSGVICFRCKIISKRILAWHFSILPNRGSMA